MDPRPSMARPVGQWIAQTQEKFSTPLVAFNASVSPDGQSLAVELVGCHRSQDQPFPFTIVAVIGPNGQVSYLRDQAGTPYFDGFFTGNSEGVYHLFGWLANSQTVLLFAEPYDLGAGGSCEPTDWISYGRGGQPEAAFQTVNGFTPAKGNGVLFYVAPDGCSGGENEIHEVQTATGIDTTIYAGPQDVGVEITGISETPGGSIVIRYRPFGGDERKLTVP